MPFLLVRDSAAAAHTAPGLNYRAPLLGGERGTAQTIDAMRALVDQALADPSFVRLAIDIVRNVPAYDELAEVEALYSWVKRRIRFTKDPLTKEKLYPPQELLKIRAGDCDDIAMLLGALDLAIGYPARLVTVSADRNHPEEFSHVYVEVEVPARSGNWIAQDAARFDSRFGLEPPVYFRKRAWSLVDESYQDLAGLGSYGTVALGDDGGGFDWGSLLQQTVQEVPAIISAASGGSSAVRTPYGTTQTAPSNPYGSFQTPYTPGYGIPPAGYGSASGYISAEATSWLPWVIGGVLVLAVLRRH